jgi:hypothetical protein
VKTRQLLNDRVDVIIFVQTTLSFKVGGISSILEKTMINRIRKSKDT